MDRGLWRQRRIDLQSDTAVDGSRLAVAGRVHRRTERSWDLERTAVEGIADSIAAAAAAADSEAAAASSLVPTC